MHLLIIIMYTYKWRVNASFEVWSESKEFKITTFFPISFQRKPVCLAKNAENIFVESILSVADVTQIFETRE